MISNIMDETQGMKKIKTLGCEHIDGEQKFKLRFRNKEKFTPCGLLQASFFQY